MKIWIDFINTPQVTFFIPFIEDFRKDKHEILLTCRDSGNTVALLEKAGLPFTIIGEKAGKGAWQKATLFPRRLLALYRFIKQEKPGVAASQSSFSQAPVAWLLRIPCLYTNDNEHAKGNLFGFLFAKKVILPSALSSLNFTKHRPLRSKLTFYRSVKEAIYLSQSWQSPDSATSSGTTIYFRPEPSSAQYYHGPLNFFDEILIKLTRDYKVVVLPRDKNQQEHYGQEKFSGLKVCSKPMSLQEILADCLLFIGAGGSMTREMAVLETPVISIYQAELLAVDNYLIGKGLLKINPGITYEEIITTLNSFKQREKKWEILKEGVQSYSLIKTIIYNLMYE